MQNNSSKTNRILLVIVILLLVTIIYILLNAKKVENVTDNPVETQGTITKNKDVTPVESVKVPPANAIPKFEDYKISYNTNFARATNFSMNNASGDDMSEFFKWKIGELVFSEKPDFAGYYAHRVYGCGTSCGVGALVDLRIGKVIGLPFDGNNDVLMEIGSTLLAEITTAIPYDPGLPRNITDFKNKDAKLDWYNFDTKSEKLSKIKTLYCDLTFKGDIARPFTKDDFKNCIN
jgi:hypothetical protein